jgi:hypothetical protein
VLTGMVIGRCLHRHTQAEFIDFLHLIDRNTPRRFDLHLVVENSSTHKTPRSADGEVDPSTRHQLITQIFSQINNDLVALPMFSEVVITSWLADRITGPIGAWNQSAYGASWNIDYWYRVGA